jgi:UDP:flavonoid glycosyltransferase YjiC (YdhE family)
MRIAIISFGSRGDVQPFVALADGLQRAGHDVVLGGPSNFAGMAAAYSIPFRPLSFDSQELADRPDVKKVLESGSALRYFRLSGRALVMDVINVDAWNMARDAEAMVFKAEWPTAGYSIARKRGIPGFQVDFMPLEPTRELPGIMAGFRTRSGPIWNRITSELSCRVFWRLHIPSANRFRQFLDMPPLATFGPMREYARTRQPVFYAYSPTLLPKPSDWRPDAHVVGYFFLDPPPGWQPAADLCRFLEAGPKPVCVGFGSMPSRNPTETALAVVEALRRSGQRAILQRGWGKLSDGLKERPDVFLADDLPHGWLFPRTAAVIHHGGSGTTGAVLRAGVPSIVIPHNFDQPYWAGRVHALGVSLPLRLRDLTTDRLAAAIRRAVTDAGLRERAADIGAKVRAEEGVARAVALIDQYAARFAAPSAGGPQSP